MDGQETDHGDVDVIVIVVRLVFGAPLVLNDYCGTVSGWFVGGGVYAD